MESFPSLHAALNAAGAEEPAADSERIFELSLQLRLSECGDLLEWVELIPAGRKVTSTAHYTA